MQTFTMSDVRTDEQKKDDIPSNYKCSVTRKTHEFVETFRMEYMIDDHIEVVLTCIDCGFQKRIFRCSGEHSKWDKYIPKDDEHPEKINDRTRLALKARDKRDKIIQKSCVHDLEHSYWEARCKKCGKLVAERMAISGGNCD